MTRVLGLARANTLLLVRNRMTLLYALVFPLLPLLMVLLGSGDAADGGPVAITSALTIAFLFPIFYNVLSMVVTRRDELVLKRLRTGEALDIEIIAALALPGVVITWVLALLLVPLGMLAGLDFPSNLAIYLVAVVCGSATYVGLALWTAAWTRNAEAAQMTSLPVMVLALVGQFADLMPDALGRIAELTPGAALMELVEVGWFAGDGAVLSPLAVLVGWAVLGCWLAARTMRWEPRS